MAGDQIMKVSLISVNMNGPAWPCTGLKGQRKKSEAKVVLIGKIQKQSASLFDCKRSIVRG